jgi:hypothetical protein
LNAIIESARVERLSGEPEIVLTPSHSGKGQKIARCASCRVAVWSHYAQAGDVVSFIRVGTLDQPDSLQPDVHIYTESKQPWVVLPPGARAVEQFYKPAEVWSEESRARMRAVRS